jgi:hypothetical protein
MTINTFIVEREKDDSAVRDPQTITSSAKWVLKFLERYFSVQILKGCLLITLYLR